MTTLLPPTPYGDNVIELYGRDRPKGLKAVELSPGVYAPATVSIDPITGQQVVPAGARGGANAASYQDVRAAIPDPVLLHATSAVPVAAGMIGASGGQANDTQLMSVLILKNAGPATLTVAGFRGEDGAARNMVFTGSTSTDTVVPLGGLGLQNSGAPMTLTASVADVVLVSVRSTGAVPGRLPTGFVGIVGNAPRITTGVVTAPSAGAATLSGVAPSLH